MRASLLVFLSLAFLAIASGCQSGETATGTPGGFVGGNDGIKLSFLESSPPDEVFETAGGNPFNFQAIVMVENVGEHEIFANELKVDLKGFFPGDFGVTGPIGTELTEPNSENLIGVSKNSQGDVRKGSIEQLTFPENGNFAYGTLDVDQSFEFTAEACYMYVTTAVSQLCLKKDLRDANTEICSVSGSNPVSNSGAPVHVTSVVQDIAGTDSIRLDFEVRKVGNVDVFFTSEPTTRPKCETSDYLGKDRVKVTVTTGVKASNAGVECLGLANIGADKASGELILENGAARFSCIQKLDGIDVVDGIKSFKILLDYDVRESIDKTVLVKDVE
ncbi:hypothetical protein CMO88_03580 [Candidatus Woesearchaeota archaeon]|nr:hypothetical protein [Candidatus Woesearchaeota archaeon]|tara:strand:+ start:11771 stop:12766 length:996 start_codon:yes stop_codon:yes gene_type:complete